MHREKGIKGLIEIGKNHSGTAHLVLPCYLDMIEKIPVRPQDLYDCPQRISQLE